MSENYVSGWIKIFRSIRKHWIWTDPVKFHRWIDIILEVNHTEKKVNIGYEIFECKRGQSFHSLRTWAKRWNTTPKTVQKFFKLLEKDEMIILKTIGKGKHSTTCITVCNYDSYQSENGFEETLGKHKVNANGSQGKRKLPTNKNDKKEKNEECLIAKLKKNDEIFNSCQMKTGLSGSQLDTMLEDWQLYFKSRFEDWRERNGWQLLSSFVDFANINKSKPKYSNNAGSGDRNWK